MAKRTPRQTMLEEAESLRAVFGMPDDTPVLIDDGKHEDDLHNTFSRLPEPKDLWTLQDKPDGLIDHETERFPAKWRDAVRKYWKAENKRRRELMGE